MPNFSDPSIAFRVVVIAFAAIATILLVAGTAVDEYVTNSMGAMGCQKVKDDTTGFSYRAGFKAMNTLSFVIIFATSVLCVLLAAATALHVLVLLKGTHQKPACIASALVAFLLPVVVALVYNNFTKSGSARQLAAILGSEGYAQAKVDYAAANVVKSVNKELDRYSRLGDSMARDLYYGRRKRAVGSGDFGWGASYRLLNAATSLAGINQLLLFAIRLMTKRGISTFGALKDKIIATVRDRPFLIKLGITALNLLLFYLMMNGTINDRYIDRKGWGTGCVLGARLYDCNGGGDETMRTFKDMRKLAFVLILVTSLVCVLLFVAIALCVVQLKKDKNFTMPLLGLSGVTTVLILASIVIACVNFTAKHYFPGENISVAYQASFKYLFASFPFSLINTGLNVYNMRLAKNGGGGGGASTSKGTATSVPSSVPPPSQPSQASSAPAPSSK